VEFLSGDLFDDQSEDDVSGIGVGVSFTGRKPQGNAGEEGDVIGETPQARRRSRLVFLSEDVSHPGAVRDELLDRDPVGGGTGRSGRCFAIVSVSASFFCEASRAIATCVKIFPIEARL
jgi:hypothetical protein